MASKDQQKPYLVDQLMTGLAHSTATAVNFQRVPSNARKCVSMPKREQLVAVTNRFDWRTGTERNEAAAYPSDSERLTAPLRRSLSLDLSAVHFLLRLIRFKTATSQLPIFWRSIFANSSNYPQQMRSNFFSLICRKILPGSVSHACEPEEFPIP